MAENLKIVYALMILISQILVVTSHSKSFFTHISIIIVYHIIYKRVNSALSLDMTTWRIGGGFKHPSPHPRFHAPAPAPAPVLKLYWG